MARCWTPYSMLVAFATLVSSNSVSVGLEPFFRHDYKYVSRQDAFYKVLRNPQRFTTAHARCTAEGAQVAYPRTESEAALLGKLLKENVAEHVKHVWVGAHDRFAEGFYQTIDGEDIETQYENWCEGEPNDASNNEDCMVMNREGRLNDVNCEITLPAICRRPRSWTLKTNPVCETVDPAYVPDVDGGRCYKIHTEPRNWSQAYGICHAEQAYLVEINSEREANLLAEFLKNYPQEDIKGNFQRYFVGVGFNDILIEGDYRTSHGRTLQEAGYNEWLQGQPDNHGESEHCGSATRDMKLNDIHCAAKMIFICEKEIGDPNAVDLFSRVGEPQ